MFLFLLLRFLEGDVLAGLGIVLLELDLAGHEFLVLARPIHLTGRFVAQLDETILRHIDQIIGSSRLPKTRKKGKRTRENESHTKNFFMRGFSRVKNS